jgi:hypothetical protein
MNLDVTIQNYFAAVGKLYSLSSAKRYKVIESELLAGEIGDIAQSINRQVFQSTNVDLLKTEDEVELLKYEKGLSFLVSEYTSKKITKRDVSDEIDILRNYRSIDPSCFRHSIILVDNGFAEILSKIGLNKRIIIKKLADPALAMISPKETDTSFCNYLCYKEIGFNGTVVKVCYHLMKRFDEENLSLKSIFIVEDEAFRKYEHSPVHMFLNCLDRYGYDFTISDKHGRFIQSMRLPVNNVEEARRPGFFAKQFIPKVPRKTKLMLRFGLMEAQDSILAEFIYGINLDLYLKKHNEILGHEH